MREILFRGKRMDDGEWVEGYLVKAVGGECMILPVTTEHCGGAEFSEGYHCDPTTVGQYTGLTDKNGKRIFEGDIVAQNWYDYDEPRDDSFGKVVFCEYDCSFSVMDVNKDGFMPLGRCGSYHWEVEVIGNIHDNPELLKGGDD